jgi:GAF domain-containing protein
MQAQRDEGDKIPAPKTCGTIGKDGADIRDGRHQTYVSLATELEALLALETDTTANLANAAAAIFHGLPALNWAGFYLLRKGVLVLGPFQGKPACIRIAVGKGVCGTAAQRRRSVLVPDVPKKKQ